MLRQSTLTVELRATTADCDLYRCTYQAECISAVVARIVGTVMKCVQTRDVEMCLNLYMPSLHSSMQLLKDNICSHNHVHFGFKWTQTCWEYWSTAHTQREDRGGGGGAGG